MSSMTQEEKVEIIKGMLLEENPFESIAQAVKVGKPDAKEQCLGIFKQICENDVVYNDYTAKLEEALDKLK